MLPPAGADELVTKDLLRAELALMRQEMAELRVEVHEGFARVSDRMADLVRTIVIAMVTLWISGVALAFVAARLAG